MVELQPSKVLVAHESVHACGYYLIDAIRGDDDHLHPAICVSQGIPEPHYPFHDRTVMVTSCGRLGLYRNLSNRFYGVGDGTRTRDPLLTNPNNEQLSALRCSRMSRLRGLDLQEGAGGGSSLG